MTNINIHPSKAKAFVVINCLLLILSICIVSCKNDKTAPQKSATAVVSCQGDNTASLTESKEVGFFEALKTKSPIQIDGCGKDAIWSSSTWYGMNYKWMGNQVDSTDYHGRFKVAWDQEHLYILVEIIDDKLNPTLGDGLENFWKGDYVEVFIDEDKSGGDHKFNHQAFAYHVSTEGHAIDQSTLQKPIFLDDHVNVKRSQEGNKHLWEMAIKLFDKDFDENAPNNIPVKIVAQKSIGFSIAYGDNDGNNNRENFMGSKKTHGNNNDGGYINADVFGELLFRE
ncbi:sugar-binding protein [Kordia sp. YSTF-M3]|uniref:Sugar-binding protein n=1 Tax=Kordia aestuariivivens TaxID=2759037 RepID=A0ABR7Q480_9FLAO|nr:sugar-binding protein [Kordia aestuariivivens]MBC8753360.1 sugar-binding protein [Kordia aestuariivivens]